MRISKLYMPAVLTVGALALAGCGGGSGTTGPGDTDPDPATIKIVKGAYFGDDTNRYTCDADDGCEYTVDADGEVQETEAQLETAGFVITQPEDPRTCGTGTVENDDGVCVPDTSKPSPLQLSQALEGAVDKLETMSGTGKDSALMKARDARAKARSLVETKGVSVDARAAAVEAAGYLTAVQDAIEDVKKALEAAGNVATDKQKEDAMVAQEAAELTLGRLGFINRAFDTDAKLDKRASDTAALVRGLFYDPDGTTFIDEFALTNEIHRVSAIPTLWNEGAFRRGSAGERGETFAEIFGPLVVDVPHGGNTPAGGLPKGISVEGEKVPSAEFTAEDNRIETGERFMGIMGSYVYAGELDADGNRPAVAMGTEFDEDWYFFEPVPTNRYVEDTTQDDLTYKPAEFVEWGLWLVDDADGDGTADDTALRLYAGPGVGSGPVVNPNQGWGAIDGAATSATYEGSATGLSARRTGGTTAEPTYASGHFTADVELNATFGASPMLGGTIDNFQGGSHTDGNWELTLTRRAFPAGGFATGAVTGANNGSWSAYSYGGANVADGVTAKRPDGIYGDFVAEFGAGGNARRGDGVAAGVYHTTPKQE
ncbi:MAG: hypothetical protein OXD36_01035 [Rhodobacter sp.]|nr:hypothetical protein [Rhodobacter sp.]